MSDEFDEDTPRTRLTPFTPEDRAKGQQVRRERANARREAAEAEKEERAKTREFFAELRKMGINIAREDDILDRLPELTDKLLKTILVTSLSLVASGEPEFQPKGAKEAMQVATSAIALRRLMLGEKGDGLPATPEARAEKLAGFRQLAKQRSGETPLTLVPEVG